MKDFIQKSINLNCKIEVNLLPASFNKTNMFNKYDQFNTKVARAPKTKPKP
jgi:hypothetical protein